MRANFAQPDPIFLFSLPRSGSTFVQRVLGSHPAIATASEPWVLLPYLYTLRETGAYAEYGHHLAASAIHDFYYSFVEGKEDYLSEIRNITLNMYAKSSAYDRQQYFLDKTPRYHLIVEDILEMFPNGKFIFLWRNPVSVMASIIQTWGQGKWILYKYHVDLFKGIRNLISAFQKHRHKVIGIRYEDLVTVKESHWEAIFHYLKLSFDRALLTQFQQTILSGRLGDTTGLRQYQSFSTEPLMKWRNVMANPLRRYKCRQYLQWIGKDRLEVMGYNLQDLLDDLDQVWFNYQHLGSDIIRMGYGPVYRYMEPQILRRKLRRFVSTEDQQ